MPKISRRRSGTYVADFDFSKGGDLAATLNMYCNHKGANAIESFPGFRCLADLHTQIHGIFPFNEMDDTYLVHAGDALYSCSFVNKYKDLIARLKLCNMADADSFAFRLAEKIYVIDGNDITLVNANESVQKLSETPDIAYVPTTYINGEEAEQVNILSDLFKEEIKGASKLDYSFGSEELIYEIISEAEGTCAVCGSGNITSGRADVPSRKMINGRYYKVTEISEGAFKNNKNIKKIILSPTVKKVGHQAFFGCTTLECIVMPDGIEEIDSSAFAECTSLDSVYLGATCKSIYYNSFDNCSSLENIFISGKIEDIEDCEGFGIMLNYSLSYECKYTDFYFGIPVFTPAKSISQVLVNGSAVSYTYSLASGTIKLSSAVCDNLEGANIIISGKINREKIINSERKTPLSLLLSRSAKDAILSAKAATVFDDRAILYGSPYAKSIALTSSKPLSGDTDLLYFGELDYFAVGTAEHEISHITTMAKYIIVSKKDDMGGSIFVYTPKGPTDAAFGRSYEELYRRVELGIKSNVAIYHWMAHFVTSDGVWRMKISSTAPTIEKVSDGKLFAERYACPALDELIKEYYGNEGDIFDGEIIICTFLDFLLIIKGGEMLLGDIHLPRKTSDGFGYTWFYMCGIGAYVNEQIRYCYAESAPSGFYIHPKAGEVCHESVYSVSGSDGELIYYVYIGNRRYAVIPTGEHWGGTYTPAKFILPRRETMIFATEAGHICAFNTDKRGVPPMGIYEADNFNAEEYKKNFGETIHPDFYVHDKRGVLYAIATEGCDGEVPNAEKRSLRDGLTVSLDRRSREPVHFAEVLDGDIYANFEIPIGDLDFSDFNFALLSMERKDAETISILESQEKWINKQIIVYTYGLKSPFAIQGLNLEFRIASKIKND
jgi:hypothetical protein